MKERNSILRFIYSFIIIIFAIALLNYSVDPFFHYRKPNNGLCYPIEYERYQNDGIVKNFKYNAIIVGTSMCENFKTSEFNELFDVNSIKVPNSGGSFKEINDLLKTAFDNNENINYVIRSLDYEKLMESSDTMRYSQDWYPTYLYDNQILNDVKYLLNKSTTMSSISVLVYSIMGIETTSFDDYANWMEGANFGKENFIGYERSEKKANVSMSEMDLFNLENNIEKNVISIAINNPETKFYYFFTPYSICYFDTINNNGQLRRQLEAEAIVIERLVQIDNIYLFSFFNDPNIICNLDNYKDIYHYSEDINTYI